VALRALCLAHAGRCDEAAELRKQFQGSESDDDETSVNILQNLLEAAVLCNDIPAARALLRRLAAIPNSVGDSFRGVSRARLLGGAARLLGERVRARAYYEESIAMCSQVRFRPELALSHLELAELLLDDAGAMNRAPTSDADRLPSPPEGEGPGMRGDSRAEALAHLDFAIAELRDMKMQPALERALRHKEVLKA
jgi:hypothetical protein